MLYVGFTEILHDSETLTEVEHCHEPGLNHSYYLNLEAAKILHMHIYLRLL